MTWTIDDPEFVCGWVSPDGHTFSCAQSVSAPMIKWKKTPDKKCRILAERRNT